MHGVLNIAHAHAHYRVCIVLTKSAELCHADDVSRVPITMHVCRYSPIQATLTEAPLRGVVLWFFAAFWADVHFYFAHRILHPWRVSFLGVSM